MRVMPIPLQHDDVFAHSAPIVPHHRIDGVQYALPALIAYPAQTIAKLAHASEAVDRVFWKAMRFVQRYVTDATLTRQLGIHYTLCDAVRMEWRTHGIARQDWIVTDDHCVCIEINSDTPSGVPETAVLTQTVIDKAHQLGLMPSWYNPSASMTPCIDRAFDALLEEIRLMTTNVRTIYCTCVGHSIEDVANTTYVASRLQSIGYETVFIPIESLRIRPYDGLYDGNTRIDVLYRLYPLEYIALEHDENTYPIGTALIDLITSGKLIVLNPPQCLLTQSKGMMALVWSLYAHHDTYAQRFQWKTPLFTDAERDTIKRYLLPSTHSPQYFIDRNIPYVTKSFFGREGHGTTISTHAPPVSRDPYYDAQPKMYQQYVEMPTATVPTDLGDYTGHVLTGVFVIGRTFAGILPRIGTKITDNTAYFCPAVVLDGIPTKED